MQSLAHTLPANTKEVTQKASFDWLLIATTVALILCGSFTYSLYPAPVNAAALGLMVGLFYYALQREDPVSFFIQLFIGNFFIFGNKLGGNYNLAAFSSIVFYTAINGKILFLRQSVYDNAIKTAMLIWCVFEMLGVMGGNTFALPIEIQNVFSFFMLVYLFYFVSRIAFTSDDFYKILITFSIFFWYEFVVALNQKYEFYYSTIPFFPSIDKTVDFDMDIVRSGSTLNNFEAYAELCTSLISLLLPGILSGGWLKKSKLFYYFSILTIIVAVVSIVLSATRSSLFLLPIAVAGSCFLLGRRLKAKLIIGFAIALGVLFALNVSLKIVDFSVFEERNETMDNVSVETMVNGDAMNRGGLFPYAFKQMENTGVIGRGYFASPEEYRDVQFRKGEMEGIADYHNLYMASYVMWGAIGFIAMMFLFFYSLYQGWRTYWSMRKEQTFTTDLLLGFNLLFLILMINQFKIQFIRDVNYFMLILLFLSLYISLTHFVKQSAPAPVPRHRKRFEN